jgi:hypothetical protein
VTLKNETYNALKFIALVLLPAAATAYSAFAVLWHLGNINQVIGTLSAVDTSLGAILHVSAKSYSTAKPVVDGKLIIDTSNPGKDVYQFALHIPISELDQKKSITLEVEPGSSMPVMIARP